MKATVSHYQPATRTKDEMRLACPDAYRAERVRYCYRTLRVFGGFGAYEARAIVVSLMWAGQFATIVEPAEAT